MPLQLRDQVQIGNSATHESDRNYPVSPAAMIRASWRIEHIGKAAAAQSAQATAHDFQNLMLGGLAPGAPCCRYRARADAPYIVCCPACHVRHPKNSDRHFATAGS